MSYGQSSASSSKSKPKTAKTKTTQLRTRSSSSADPNKMLRESENRKSQRAYAERRGRQVSDGDDSPSVRQVHVRQ